MHDMPNPDQGMPKDDMPNPDAGPKKDDHMPDPDMGPKKQKDKPCETCMVKCDGKVDECGVCNGPGIEKGKCDCEGHIKDCWGICGGTGCEDECGVCDGPGIPDWACDC